MISALAAAELKIRRVVIPPYPGLFSALGLLVADVKRIYRETKFIPVVPGIARTIDDTYARMRSEAEIEFTKFGHSARDIVYDYALEMRFQGQGLELLTSIDPDSLKRDDAAYLHEAFRATHRARYGSASHAGSIEIVTFRLTAHVPTPAAVLTSLTQIKRDEGDALRD